MINAMENPHQVRWLQRLPDIRPWY